jgi:hypothetical protein
LTAYLSDEWIAELDTALGASPAVRALPLVIDQLVRECPGGEVRYRVWVDERGGHARPSGAGDGPPDVWFDTDYGTAVAIAARRRADRAGSRLRVGGALEALTSRSDALAALGDVSGRLRPGTTFATVRDPGNRRTSAP